MDRTIHMPFTRKHAVTRFQRTLNLYQGMAVEEQAHLMDMVEGGFSYDRYKGMLDIWRSHLLNIMCSRNTTDFNILERWLANLVQNVEASILALVFVGPEGSGKTVTFRAIRRMVGEVLSKLWDDESQLKAEIQGRLEAKLLHVVEEVNPTGACRGLAGRFKTLIANQTVNQRQMYIETKEVKM